MASRFVVEDTDQRVVTWEVAGRAWALVGRREAGVPRVDLLGEGVLLATLTIDESRDLGKALEILLTRPAGGRSAAASGPDNQGKPWTPADDSRLEERWKLGELPRDIARDFGRSTGAIVARLVRLGLAEDNQAARKGLPPER